MDILNTYKAVWEAFRKQDYDRADELLAEGMTYILDHPDDAFGYLILIALGHFALLTNNYDSIPDIVNRTVAKYWHTVPRTWQSAMMGELITVFYGYVQYLYEEGHWDALPTQCDWILENGQKVFIHPEVIRHVENIRFATSIYKTKIAPPKQQNTTTSFVRKISGKLQNELRQTQDIIRTRMAPFLQDIAPRSRCAILKSIRQKMTAAMEYMKSFNNSLLYELLHPVAVPPDPKEKRQTEEDDEEWGNTLQFMFQEEKARTPKKKERTTKSETSLMEVVASSDSLEEGLDAAIELVKLKPQDQELFLLVVDILNSRIHHKLNNDEEILGSTLKRYIQMLCDTHIRRQGLMLTYISKVLPFTDLYLDIDTASLDLIHRGCKEARKEKTANIHVHDLMILEHQCLIRKKVLAGETDSAAWIKRTIILSRTLLKSYKPECEDCQRRCITVGRQLYQECKDALEQPLLLELLIEVSRYFSSDDEVSHALFADVIRCGVPDGHKVWYLKNMSKVLVNFNTSFSAAYLPHISEFIDQIIFSQQELGTQDVQTALNVSYLLLVASSIFQKIMLCQPKFEMMHFQRATCYIMSCLQQTLDLESGYTSVIGSLPKMLVELDRILQRIPLKISWVTEPLDPLRCHQL